MITVVIADRMGKGQNVAKGVEAAGGKAVIVPGMGADMRLGDVMQQENADMGISFCGSGGAGALTASTNMAIQNVMACVQSKKESRRLMTEKLS